METDVSEYRFLTLSLICIERQVEALSKCFYLSFTGQSWQKRDNAIIW